MKREELRNKLTDILSVAMSGRINLTQAERSIWDLFNPGLPPAEGAEEVAQRCPVCGGNGLVPNGFYLQTGGTWLSSSLAPETCRACNGTGVILPSYLHAQRLAEKMVEEKAVGFADWLSKLQPSQKVSAWSKNGEHCGLFTMDNEQLYKKYLKSIEP